MAADRVPPRPSGRVSSRLGKRSAFDLYAEITEQVIGMLDKGVVPWRSPILGQGRAGYPTSLASGRAYRGVNVFLLACTSYFRGYDSAYWLTFQQARQRGGSVKKGEKASMVVFFKPYEVVDTKTGEVKQVPVLRFYHVFNLNQCEGIQAPDAAATASALSLSTTHTPIEAAEALVAGYPKPPTVERGGWSAFYVPALDHVKVPVPERFESPEASYATLFHELIHSTGHSSRLARGLDEQLQPFGSPDYSREELVAELGAAFLCAQAGISPVVIENQAAYISGWLGTLRKDKKLVIAAAAAAQRAADWVRDVRAPSDGAGEASDHSETDRGGPAGDVAGP